MGKPRVYELAKELELTTREMMRVLELLHIDVKSHMSVIEDEHIEAIKKYLEGLRQPREASGRGQGSVSSRPEQVSSRKEHQSEERRAPKKTRPETPAPGARRSGPPVPATGKFGTAVAPKSQVEEDVEHEFDVETERWKPIRKRVGRKAFESKKESKQPLFAQRKGAAPRQQIVPFKPKKISIEETITVQELARRMGKNVSEVIGKLEELGLRVRAEEFIDAESAVLVAGEFGVEVSVRADWLAKELEEAPDDPGKLVERPPVVTVMGHVDHGKTSLLDAIRKTKVAAHEAGGITQHIGAYQVSVRGKKITFIDTPGHEAFTAMRARGAQVTDIAVLVVAADDGVMPQTIEAMNHARAAKVPIIVAINKIDLPEADPERVKRQLTEHGLVPEEWGGDTIYVLTSAVKGQGIENLLEMILLVAEVSELKANPDREARGTVIEAELDRGRGPVATVLVQKGTLRVGDCLVAGTAYGRVRAMINDEGGRVKEATPSMPVAVLGLSEVPLAGDKFQVVADEKIAREAALRNKELLREENLRHTSAVNLEDLFRRTEKERQLNVIVKADVQGTVEAVTGALRRLNTDEVTVNVIHGGVGSVTESDVMLARASGAIIIGFNVRPEPSAKKAAEMERVEVRTYRVIYDLLDDIRAAMEGLLEPELEEVLLGRAEVRAIFRIPKVGVVAGAYVKEGKLTNKAQVRIIRDGVVIHEGRIGSLKRFKDDAKEVHEGYECGVGIERFQDIKEGDLIEAFTVEEVKREL